MMRLILIVFFSIFLHTSIKAQTNTGNDIRLAYEYYRTKEYDKAEILFERIFAATNAKVYFTFYANCLIEQAKYDQAEKEIRKQIRKFKDEPAYLVDLGWLYKRQADFEKAEQYYNEALEQMPKNAAGIRSLASAFMQREEFDFAEKAFLKGRRMVQDSFRGDLANVYSVQRKYDKMISEYMDWIQESSSNLNAVQDRMQFFMNNDVNNEFGEYLKRELIKRIQKENASISFNKMLIWYYMQRSELDQALIQEIAIDRRLNATGKGVLELADMAKNSNDYETALRAYDYVIEKGKSKPYYYPAQSGKLNVYYLKVVNGLIQTPEEMKNLEEKYLEVIQSSGFTTNSIKSIIDLAHLQAFYLNKPVEAEKLLRQAIEVQGIEAQVSALCKIELGDVLLFNENPDYAALIYGQVEKENKDNSLGDNAKLRKAKLAYYTGNFLWAKAQFDALKESTSKPVANDALFYSVLIDENSEGDSLLTALKTYAKAELNMFRNRYVVAKILLDSLILAFPSHQILDEAYMLKAEIGVRTGNFIEAENNYKKVFTDYAYDIHADAALLKLGILYEQKMNRIEDAAELYKQLMLLYPESIFATEARKRFRRIREL